LAAIIALTRAEAEAQGADHCILKVTLADGTKVNLPGEEAAAEFARQSGGQSYRVKARKPSVLTGTSADVRAELDVLHQRLGVPEFILDLAVADPVARLNVIELLAEAGLAIRPSSISPMTRLPRSSATARFWLGSARSIRPFSPTRWPRSNARSSSSKHGLPKCAPP